MFDNVWSLSVEDCNDQKHSSIYQSARKRYVLNTYSTYVRIHYVHLHYLISF